MRPDPKCHESHNAFLAYFQWLSNFSTVVLYTLSDWLNPDCIFGAHLTSAICNRWSELVACASNSGEYPSNNGNFGLLVCNNKLLCTTHVWIPFTVLFLNLLSSTSHLLCIIVRHSAAVVYMATCRLRCRLSFPPVYSESEWQMEFSGPQHWRQSGSASLGWFLVLQGHWKPFD